MLLCLDVGNSQIFAGLYNAGDIILRFRYETQLTITSDKFGVFLRGVLRENNIDHTHIKNVAISSVVPPIDYSLRAACKKYLSVEPFFLKPDVKTTIKTKPQRQTETGADLIAAAIAAVNCYPGRDIIIVDLGTATTITAITANKEFLGGAFITGLRLSIDALSNNTAKLFPVEIIKPEQATGRSTAEALQAGLYYGHLGAIKEIITKITEETFPQKKPVIVATGGLAYLFEDARIFDAVKTDLVLDGLYLAFNMNKDTQHDNTPH